MYHVPHCLFQRRSNKRGATIPQIENFLRDTVGKDAPTLQGRSETGRTYNRLT